jgi:antitoxin component of MazEF toxin-antitoxin module
MATTTKVIAIGNSAGIILPKETLARLNVQKGDTLFVQEPAGGLSGEPLRRRVRRQDGSGRPGHSPLSRCIQKTG